MNNIVSSGKVDRWVARGEITASAAFHLGSGTASRISEMAISRTAGGEPYIPGSSLAGLLRSVAEELCRFLTGYEACDDRKDEGCPVCALFGRGPKDQEADRGGQASRLFVEDALLLPNDDRKSDAAEGFATEVRDHVGISRETGAAEPNLQFDREVAPGDSRFHFEITIESPKAIDLQLMLAVLDLWQATGFHLGGRVTTGLGQAKIIQDSLRFYLLNFENDDILRHYLSLTSVAEAEASDGGETSEETESPPKNEANESSDDEIAETEAPSDSEVNDSSDEEIDENEDDPKSAWLRVNGFDDLPEQAFKTRAELDACLTDVPTTIHKATPEEPQHFLPQHLFIDLTVAFLEPAVVAASLPDFDVSYPSDKPFVRTLLAGGRECYFLPGSSLKGILRTRAEKIIRTLNFHQAHGDEVEYKKRICACAVTRKRTGNDDTLGGCFAKSKEQREAEKMQAWEVYERSCMACRLFGNSMMRGRLFAGEGHLINENVVRTKLFDHVAIDRFAGGAAEAKKYDARPLMPAENKAPLFALRLHLERPEAWMLGLLALVLKDLHNGDMRIGHATRRGYGKMRAWVKEPDGEALDGAFALLLQGSQLHDMFSKYGFAAAESPKAIPYSLFFLPLHELFGAARWSTAPPDEETPTAKLIADCHAAFMEQLDCEAKPSVFYGRRA